MTLDTLMGLAGLIAALSLAGLVGLWIRVVDVLRRVAAIEHALGAAVTPWEERSRQDELAPDAVMDHDADREWLRDFRVPDGWRE